MVLAGLLIEMEDSFLGFLGPVKLCTASGSLWVLYAASQLYAL